MAATYEEYLDAEQSPAFDDMQTIHRQMIEDIGMDADAGEIYEELIAAASKYAAIRASWMLLCREEKAEIDSRRTSCHDSVIVKFNMPARYLKMQGRDAVWCEYLGDEKEDPYNRKRIGDMACYLVFVNSLNAR